MILVGVFALDQLHGLLAYSRGASDEDQTLLWYAGRELVHLHLHEPNFFGQNYNTTFEAIPGLLFHLLGLSLALASPLGTMLIASACWLVLAWAALRQGQPLAAAAALALPVCLTVPYLLLFDAPRGVLSGDLAGAMAIAGALTFRRPRARLAVLLAVGGLAIAWENAIALAVLPALAAIVAASVRDLLDRPRRTALTAGVALVVPAGWLVMDHLWYRAHVGDLTATNVNTSLSLSVLHTNLTHPQRLFAFYAPQLWQHAGVAIAAIVILLVLAIAVSVTTRRWAPAAAAITFLLSLLIVLSVRDTLDVHPDLYLSGSRFLLPMPIGLWVVFFFMQAAIRQHRRERVPTRRRLTLRFAMAGISLITLASLVSAQSRFASEVGAVTAADTGNHPVIVVVNPTALLAECGDLSAIYRRVRAQLLVTYQRNAAYGCAAQDSLNTLDSDYERRGWLLRAAATRPVSRILIQGWSCHTLAARAGHCTSQGAHTVLLVTPARPASVSLALTGADVTGAPRRP
jgi:hypothetical protein